MSDASAPDGADPEATQTGDKILAERGRETRVLLRRPKLRDARWSLEEAREGDDVELLVTAKNVPDGAEVTFRILEVDQDGSEEEIETLTAAVEAGEATALWSYTFTDDSDDRSSQEHDEAYAAPEYVFECSLGSLSARTETPLMWRSWIEVQVHDRHGEPAASGRKFLLVNEGTDEVVEGVVERGGWVRADPVAPGSYVLVVEGMSLTRT